MKKSAFLMAVLLAGAVAYSAEPAPAKQPKEEKIQTMGDKNPDMVEKCKKTAEEHRAAKLAPGEKEAFDELSVAADEYVEYKHDLAKVYDKMALAYSNDDKKALELLDEEKKDIERDIRMVEKKKQLLHRVAKLLEILKRLGLDQQTIDDIQFDAVEIVDDHSNVVEQLEDLEAERAGFEKALEDMIKKYEDQLKQPKPEANDKEEPKAK